jgi:hypothetical protein
MTKAVSELLNSMMACLASSTARGLPSEASGGTRSNGFHWSQAVVYGEDDLVIEQHGAALH